MTKQVLDRYNNYPVQTMVNTQPSCPGQLSEEPPTLARALSAHLECLKELSIEDCPALHQKTAQTLVVLVNLLSHIDRTIFSQLEVLGKNHPDIKTMAQAVQDQGLLNIHDAIKAVFNPAATRMTRLQNYGDLLTRWWSAVLAGVQTTVLELPHELTEALNPASWQVEKKRWAAEEAAYWEHFKFVIRPELPLKLGDRFKRIQADKTLDAYSILGSAARDGRPES